VNKLAGKILHWFGKGRRMNRTRIPRRALEFKFIGMRHMG
jgi:hypothetical protein